MNPLHDLRFIADANVGRLAKWLRVMGYDALYIPDIDDGELVRIGMEENRIVLTKDRYILERRVVTSGMVRVVLIMMDDFREQLRFLTNELGLCWNNGFTRCIECNESLRPTVKEAVQDRVPSFVYRTQDKFYECPKCGKLYWRGTHWNNMRVELADFTKITEG